MLQVAMRCLARQRGYQAAIRTVQQVSSLQLGAAQVAAARLDLRTLPPVQLPDAKAAFALLMLAQVGVCGVRALAVSRAPPCHTKPVLQAACVPKRNVHAHLAAVSHTTRGSGARDGVQARLQHLGCSCAGRSREARAHGRHLRGTIVGTIGDNSWPMYWATRPAWHAAPHTHAAHAQTLTHTVSSIHALTR